MTLMKKRNRVRPEFETFGDLPTTFTQILDDFFGQALSTHPRQGVWRPEMNVSETADQFEITVALPGIDRDAIEINLEDHTLIISGEREWREDSNRKPRLVESSFGTFKRSLPLPDTIDPDSIEAKLENGVLYININKLEEKTMKKIDVK